MVISVLTDNKWEWGNNRKHNKGEIRRVITAKKLESKYGKFKNLKMVIFNA